MSYHRLSDRNFRKLSELQDRVNAVALSSTDFFNCTFSHVDFKDIIFTNSFFTNCFFDHVLMIDCQFINCTLNHCVFTQGDLQSLDVDYCYLGKCTFNEINMTGASFYQSYLDQPVFQESMIETIGTINCKYKNRNGWVDLNVNRSDEVKEFNKIMEGPFPPLVLLQQSKISLSDTLRNPRIEAHQN